MNLQYLFISFLFVITIMGNLNAQQFLDRTIIHDGETRGYKIYIPSSYDGSISFPLLFNFHGGNGDIDSQIAIADMRQIADTANFFIVYPQALPDPNDGGSTNWLHKDPTMIDDVFFVEAMIDEIASQYNINDKRIYACGYSLGGEFTYELACRLNNRIAAVGIVARTMGVAAFDNCQPIHPTGILTILGTDDLISPYDGLVWNGIQFYLSADQMHNYWTMYNNASTQPNISQLPNIDPSDGSSVERYSWGNGDGCVSVEHLKVNGGGHDWPGSFGNMDINASLEIWNYVSKFNLEGLIDCSVTSILESLSNREKIVFYPNPVKNELTVAVDKSNAIKYEVYVTNGNLILSGNIDLNNDSIDLSTLSSGIYFLKLGNTLSKFIKIE